MIWFLAYALGGAVLIVAALLLMYRNSPVPPLTPDEIKAQTRR